MIGIKTMYNAVSKRHIKHLWKYSKAAYNKINYCMNNCDLLTLDYSEFLECFKDNLVMCDDGKQRIPVNIVIRHMNTYHKKRGCYVQMDNLRLALILDDCGEFRKNRKFGEVKKIWREYSYLLSAKTLKMSNSRFSKFINSLDLDTYRTRFNKYINFEDFCEKIDYRPEANRYQV